MEVEHLLVEWRGPPVNKRARMPVRWGGYHRPVCIETVVGPLHHSSVEGWGRQQHDLHLGNRIYNNIYTQCSNSISDFYGHSNHVKDNFRMCDSFTLSNLHYTFCISFYGIELYNFNKCIHSLHGVNVCELCFVCLIYLLCIHMNHLV